MQKSARNHIKPTKGRNSFFCGRTSAFFFIRCLYRAVSDSGIFFLPLKLLCKISIQVFDLDSLLLHGIPVAYGNCSVFFRLKVISYAEWRSNLILTAVTLADISTVIKFAVVLLA